ncbi:MAG: hypothetical protein AAGE92_07430 [Cyanobacteria bacterium P01_G01_bin.4]
MHPLFARSPVLAVNFSHSVLGESQDIFTNTSNFWEQMWRETFLTGGFTGYDFIVYVAIIIAIFALGVFWVQLAKVSLRSNDYGDTLTRLVMAVLLLCLLMNGAQFPARLIYGIRLATSGLTQQVLNVQLQESSIRSVLQDHVLTNSGREILTSEYKNCQEMGRPIVPVHVQDFTDTTSPEQAAVFARHECYGEVAVLAEQLQNEVETSGLCQGDCVGFLRFVARVQERIREREQAYQEADLAEQIILDQSAGLEVFEVLLEDAFSRGTKALMGHTQIALVNLMELVFWLSALISPVVIAYSLFPTRTVRPFWIWLMTLSSTGLSLIYYVVLIGAMALFMSGELGTATNDVAFSLVFGLFGPVLAVGLSTGTAFTAVAGMARTGAALASAALQTATLVALRR